MKRFSAGLAVGLLLGLATAAGAAVLAGDSGYLLGWEVKVGGEQVCSDPYVWTVTHEIECDAQ